MALLQELLRTQSQQIALQDTNRQQWIGISNNEAYAQYFPTWEVTAPQYQTPVAWTLAKLGYKTNEVAYACIDLWMKTISEPPMLVWDKVKDEEVKNHPFVKWLQEPTPGLSQMDFWRATEMYLKIAGILAWEKDMDNGGDLKYVWPMMPQYCSYLRGESQLLRAIRYQPYSGLPYLDIPRERFALFSYTDPQYYGLKPFSPTMVLADIIGVDNDMTIMMQQFLRNGAFVSGLLSTEQQINEQDAKFAKDRFREQHGGMNNAGDVVVVGKGMKFERMGQTFREMVFPEVDARNETRICMGYHIPPILVSAKSGMDRATYSNYEQARKAWYEEQVTSEWKFLEERATRDLLRIFDDDPNHICVFDKSKVKALQEDRTETWNRAKEAYKARLIRRNDGLKEMGLQPLDSDDPLGLEYYQTAMTQTSTSAVTKDDLDKPNSEESDEPEVIEKARGKGQDVVTVNKADMDEEEKAFRVFASKRLKENKPHKIPLFEFKYVDDAKQRRLLNEFGVPDPDAEMVLEGLRSVLEEMRNSRGNDVGQINIVANIQPGESVVDVKSIDIPAPVVNVEVNPAPVVVNTPKLTRSYDKIKRDAGNNIEAKFTQYEYEGDADDS